MQLDKAVDYISTRGEMPRTLVNQVESFKRLPQKSIFSVLIEAVD
jgi:hypothetical protein